MATQITRVNPLDLQENVAIGVALPFNQPSVFKSVYNTKDQIKYKLINLLLTNRGERVFNPEFGADINSALFEGITEETISNISNLIKYSTSIYIPEIKVTDVDINTKSLDQYTLSDQHILRIVVSYRILISGTADQVTVEFL